MRRSLMVWTLVFSSAGWAHPQAGIQPESRPIPGTGCKLFLTMIEQDERTSDLAITGLTSGQVNWIRKSLKKPDVEGTCPLPLDPKNKRVPLVALTDAAMGVDTAGKTIFVVKWKQISYIVPDQNGGHFAVDARGVLYRMGSSASGDLIPIGPVHDTSHTVFSDPTVSFLKAVLKTIHEQ